MRVALIVVAIAFTASPSHASPSCMTMAEARAAFPGKHLWWHGPNKCWDATPGRRQFAKQIRAREIQRETQRETQREAQREARKAAREAQPETASADEKKPPNWTQDSRWREAMSRMRAEDDAALQSSAPARASADMSEPPSPPRMDWRDRWVDVAQGVPLIVDKSEPVARLTAAAPGVDPIVTPVRVMLALLAFVLMLGIVEILNRGTLGKWQGPDRARVRYALLRFSMMLRKSVARLR
ncbi:hypothetical protein JQ628_13290 [Bradyrhizobium lablabi]|uniref:hypothetical protein n=1 Tax=Bradyrhizobium lablabi TaxID=722472 RepID=UPI001BA9AC32|nr:hypothetical protein [Bradyrhizobium lablabi]MBR1122495.1 hypothetical protein [Bradyrhizobium lablabi]